MSLINDEFIVNNDSAAKLQKKNVITTFSLLFCPVVAFFSYLCREYKKMNVKQVVL